MTSYDPNQDWTYLALLEYLKAEERSNILKQAEPYLMTEDQREKMDMANWIWHEVKELEENLKQTINPSFNQELEDKFIENYSPVNLPPMLSRKRGVEL